MIMHHKIRWTIAMKVGSIVTVLVIFILILLVNSMIAVNKIQLDLKELAKVDIPLTDISSEIEITQLERHIAMDEFLNITTKDKGAINPDKISIIELGRKLKLLLERGISVTKRGLASENSKNFQKILSSLNELSDEFEGINQVLVQWVTRISSGDDPDGKFISAVLNNNKNFEEKTLILIKDIQKLTERKTLLAAKHEQLFKIVNISMGLMGVSLGIVLGTLIVTGIRTNIFQLSRRIEEVTTAIKEKEDIPTNDAVIIKSSDELGILSNELSKLINSLSDDLNRRDKLSKQLNELATIDHLTRSFNRFKWDKDHTLEIKRAKRNETDLSLICFDIDHFKRINDTFGHDIGDSTLVDVVRVAGDAIRNCDSLYRTGGEEFAILLPGITVDDGAILAERIRHAIENHDFDTVGRVTISLGVTGFKGNSDDAVQFVKRADQALYHSKNTGRNKVSIG